MFGELRAFVNAALGLDATHDTTVELLELENPDDIGFVGLKVLADDDVLVGPAAGSYEMVTVDRRTIGVLLDVLPTICDEDGDARKSLVDINVLRNTLKDALVAQ